MFEGFFRFFSGILAWFYSLAPSLGVGVAIILLTLLVMLVITPLTLKSTRSMLQMQKMQPELKKLQEKHKGDREKLNQEMMAFYKDNNINPVSGCVPVIAQMPVFLILYRVLRGITRRDGGTGSGIGHVFGQRFSGISAVGQTPWRLNDQPFNPEHLDSGTRLFKDLSNQSKMSFLGVNLAISPADALRIGILTSIPVLILIVLMLVTQVYQNRQIQGRNKNATVNPQQQMIMKFLPFMLPIFSFSFPAGLSLYYFVQGICRVATQGYITKKFYPELGHEVIDVTAKDTTKGPGRGPIKTLKPTEKPVEKKPPIVKPGSSTRSQAVQRKDSSDQRPSAGRKSGSPRRRSGGKETS